MKKRRLNKWDIAGVSFALVLLMIIAARIYAAKLAFESPTGKFCNIHHVELKRAFLIASHGDAGIETNPPHIHCLDQQESGDIWLYCPKCAEFSYGGLCP